MASLSYEYFPGGTQRREACFIHGLMKKKHPPLVTGDMFNHSQKGRYFLHGEGSRPCTRVCGTGLGPSPFCWKPQQLPPAHSGPAWPLSPGPCVANGDLPPLTPGHPLLSSVPGRPKVLGPRALSRPHTLLGTPASSCVGAVCLLHSPH